MTSSKKFQAAETMEAAMVVPVNRLLMMDMKGGEHPVIFPPKLISLKTLYEIVDDVLKKNRHLCWAERDKIIETLLSLLVFIPEGQAEGKRDYTFCRQTFDESQFVKLLSASLFMNYHHALIDVVIEGRPPKELAHFACDYFDFDQSKLDTLFVEDREVWKLIEDMGLAKVFSESIRLRAQAVEQGSQGSWKYDVELSGDRHYNGVNATGDQTAFFPEFP